LGAHEFTPLKPSPLIQNLLERHPYHAYHNNQVDKLTKSLHRAADKDLFFPVIPTVSTTFLAN